MPNQGKRLIFRLSSLGDIVLSTAVLQVENENIRTNHWVVAKEFAEILNGHPQIQKVWSFNRRSQGMRGWFRLCRELEAQEYAEILDLHCSLRTRFARLYFWWHHFRRTYQVQPGYRWKTISKKRFRLFGLYIFKSLWPKTFHPSSWIRYYTVFAGGRGDERPSLLHLLKSGSSIEIPYSRYICVMPGSKWKEKCWPEKHFLELLRGLSLPSVILGTKTDQGSELLVQSLKKEGFPYIDGVGRWNLTECARVLAGSIGYIGNDTGMAHLAEAVGKRAFVLFGPTTPEMGFAPWRIESHAIGSELWCRPCSKDGTFCHRLGSRRRACLTDLSAEDVLRRTEGWLK